MGPDVTWVVLDGVPRYIDHEGRVVAKVDQRSGWCDQAETDLVDLIQRRPWWRRQRQETRK